MKLKLQRSTFLANKQVSKPHMYFKKDQVVDTEDQYVIKNLIAGGFAAEMGKEVSGYQEKEPKYNKKKMIKEEIKNKMQKVSLNKKV